MSIGFPDLDEDSEYNVKIADFEIPIEPWGTARRDSNRLNPIAKAILEGMYDEDCPLYKLRGLWHVCKTIWLLVIHPWKNSIHVTRSVSEFNGEGVMPFLPLLKSKVKFPAPSGIQVNMMPIKWETNIKEMCLPKYLEPYFPLILTCVKDYPLAANTGSTVYLTVHESKVEKEESQRRPGVHTETPGRIHIRGHSEDRPEKGSDGGASDAIDEEMEVERGVGTVMREFGWGCGLAHLLSDNLTLEGGIFMASTVDNSCRVWDCQVRDPEVIGHLGDVEHLRNYLGRSSLLKKNTLYWITDTTPHESLPLPPSTYRQYFRLVTERVSAWYLDHSSANPLGVAPCPEMTQIVRGSKFDPRGVELVGEAEYQEAVTAAAAAAGEAAAKGGVLGKVKSLLRI